MVFSDDDLAKLGRAFDRAWDRFLRLGMLNAGNLSRSQEALAKSILEKAKLGERDEWCLAREAFIQLTQLELQQIHSIGPGIRRRPPQKPRAHTAH